MKKLSAGIVVFRRSNGYLEVLLAHMGSPWWANKDTGAWSIPKGLVEEGEEPLATAKREFAEEFGMPAPAGNYIELGEIKQSNKNVVAWAVESDIDETKAKSNTFETEWPPRSGQMQQFPEVDRASWFRLEAAGKKLVKGQKGLLEKLAEVLGEALPEPNQEQTQQTLL